MLPLKILLAGLCISTATYAQNKSGLRATIGLSKIATEGTRGDNIQDEQQLSGEFGLFTSFEIKPQSSLGLELNFSQISGNQKINMEVRDENNQAYDVEINRRIQIFYLAVPVYFTYTVDKVDLSVGLQGSVALRSNAVENGQIPDAGTLKSYQREYDDAGLKSFDFGPRLGVNFIISKSFSLEARYYYGLSNISSSENQSYKVRQVTVGARFTLI